MNLFILCSGLFYFFFMEVTLQIHMGFQDSILLEVLNKTAYDLGGQSHLSKKSQILNICD